MTEVLSEQLQALDGRVHSDLWNQSTDLASLYAEVEDAVSLSLALLARIDRATNDDPSMRPEVWTREAARVHVPAYTRWFALATPILAMVKRLKAGGFPVIGVEAFVPEYLRVKLVAVDFEHNADLLEHAGSESSVPLEQVIHELHISDGERRAG